MKTASKIRLRYSLLIITIGIGAQLLYNSWGTISQWISPLARQILPEGREVKRSTYYYQVPILCFHNLDGAGPYSTSREHFREYMEMIAEEGLEVISLQRLYEHARRRKMLTRPAVVITVDDNYKNNFRLLAPILREYRYPATFFVYTQKIQANPLWGSSWEDLRRLYGENFDIQNHSHSHSSFYKPLFGESLAAYRKRIELEIIDSREILESNIPNLRIWAFAWPMGYSSDYLQRALKSAGYQLQLASNGEAVDLRRPFNGIFGRFAVQQRAGSGKDLLFQRYLRHAQQPYSPEKEQALQ